MSELQLNLNRIWCLRGLLAQAEGRTIDPQLDQHLIEQLEASHVDTTAQGFVLECQIGDCALQCVTVNQSGVLRVLDSTDDSICQ